MPYCLETLYLSVSLSRYFRVLLTMRLYYLDTEIKLAELWWAFRLRACLFCFCFHHVLLSNSGTSLMIETYKDWGAWSFLVFCLFEWFLYAISETFDACPAKWTYGSLQAYLKANFYLKTRTYGSLRIEYLIDHWAYEWTLVCLACLYASNILVILAPMLWCLCSLAKLKGIGVQVILAYYALMLTPHSDKPKTDVIFIFSWLQCQWGLYDILEHPMMNTQWW